MPAGQPTKYRPEMAEQAYKLSLLGHTDEQLAKFFEVAVATIYNWKNEHPEFLESIKNGKEVADGEIVMTLRKRAMGYEVTEEKVEESGEGGANGKKVTITEKHIPPDTTAMIFWLKNRQPKQWRDKQEVDHSSSDGTMSPSTKELSDEELEEKLKSYGIVKP